jgi:hypothetical protein
MVILSPSSLSCDPYSVAEGKKMFALLSQYKLCFVGFRHDTIFKDVYREVGILEVFVTCLHRYAALLKEKKQAQDQGKGKYELC